MYNSISMIAGAFVAIGVEAQYQYYQPYYQAYSYPMNSASVPTGWYSATREFRPIAIPYVANKTS